MSKRYDLQATTPVFKTHPFFLDQTREGKKNWEIRLHDMADDRIYQLSWLSRQIAAPEKAIDGPVVQGPFPGTFMQHIGIGNVPQPDFKPDVEAIQLVNSEDPSDVILMAYLGMEFINLMPGWCMLVLGDRLCLWCRHTWHDTPSGDINSKPCDATTVTNGLPIECECKGVN